MLKEIIKTNSRILQCPYCQEPLSIVDSGCRCSACECFYGYEDGPLDLRLQKVRKCMVEFDVGCDMQFNEMPNLHPLKMIAEPDVDFKNSNVPKHLTSEMLSYFPKAKSDESLVLDLGCGKAVNKEVCNHAGFGYVGLDYREKEATVLGDAHALPFVDESFEFMLSVAVLEHIQYPFIMMNEAYRVLKPGSRFIGTVAFLEPFHDCSYYHHTHLGLYNCLKYAGFKIEAIAPSEHWNVLIAQSKALFPKLPRKFAKMLVWPLNFLHKYWMQSGRLRNRPWATAENICSRTTGSFVFIATKE